MVQFVQPPEPTPLNQGELLPAPEPGPHQVAGLTLSDLEQMALQNNPTLSQAQARVRAARGVWQQVGLYPNPVAGYAAEEMGDNGTAGKQGGFIGQEFVTGGKLRLNRQVACQEIIRLQQELAAQQFRVVTDVRTSFYDVLVAQRAVELTDRLVKIAEQGVQAARWATQRARVEWVPNVGVQATVQHDNASGDDVAGVQVALPLPLFNRNQGNIIAADSQLVATQRNVERVRLSLQSRLAEVFRRYASAGQQVEKYRGTILPDAKETLDLVASGYQQGEFSYLNLLTVQRTYFQSNLVSRAISPIWSRFCS